MANKYHKEAPKKKGSFGDMVGEMADAYKAGKKRDKEMFGKGKKK